ncbi:D(5)-like dopamine receptor [Asterias amurensis]|uniref:D(5)-like dopamine receptor n=1 Tax=Asterias amurensis TaxID=7602 RepID=UPI003AB3CAEC
MDGIEPRSMAGTVIVIVCASLLSVVIISGNILVVTAFFKYKNLQTITNSFLVSLAFADLLIGGVDLPFYIALDIASQGIWFYGQTLCAFFVAINVCACTASILHLCIISGDRYTAVVHPITYPRRMTRKLCAILIGSAWCLSLGVAFLWIFHEKGGPSETNVGCMASLSALFSIISSLVSFFIPAVIILILYAKVFVTARAHARRIQRGRMALSSSAGQEEMRIHRGGEAATAANSSTTASYSEYRAAKTIGLVVGAFLICWLPFFTMNLVRPWCNETCDRIRYVFFWISFLNSAMNPFIYAFTNSSFKVAFWKILRCLQNRDRTPEVVSSESRL